MRGHETVDRCDEVLLRLRPGRQELSRGLGTIGMARHLSRVLEKMAQGVGDGRRISRLDQETRRLGDGVRNGAGLG